jgi:small subunit ribosomal protein S2
MRQLLEAGVHFGHQTRRWNPKMRPYIFAERNGIHIIDLAQTVKHLESSLEFVRETVARGEYVLFVGTKKQAQEPIAQEAARANQPYVNKRWLGGMLTNFVTIKKRIGLMEQLEARQQSGEFERMTKKEAAKLTDELNRLLAMLGGIRKMKRLPGAVFIVDPHREGIAVAEANRLKLPIVAMVDTNCNPQLIDWPVPSNDDAIRAVRLIAGKIADAIVEGREQRAAVMGEPLPESGLAEDEIEAMPSELPMMTEEDFLMDEFDMDEDEDA